MKRQFKPRVPPRKNYSILIGYLGLIGLVLYPSVVHPMIFPDAYRKAQAENRKGINQEDVQPGNMRIWRDPFDREKN